MNEWTLQVALKKAAYGAAKAVAMLVFSAKAVALEKKFGLTLDPITFQTTVAGIFLAGLELVHDWAKLRFPNTSWL